MNNLKNQENNNKTKYFQEGPLNMIKIGILAPDNYEEISKTFLDIFKANHIIAAIKKNSKDIKNKLAFLEKNGIEYVLIIFEQHLIYPVNLDVLILDNAPNTRLVTYSLIECISDKTILIYNTDNGYLPKLEHPNAIDYGFSQNSSVTVSSINYFPDTKSFILYIQNTIYNPFYKDISISEFHVTPINNHEISSQLPAVITALLFEIPICKSGNKVEI